MPHLPPNVPEIDPNELQRRLSSGSPIFLLDVREAEEYRQAHIDGSCWIPLGDLPRKLGELPRNQDIVCICRSGHRSHLATAWLNQNGYHAQNLVGGMLAWQDLHSSHN